MNSGQACEAPDVEPCREQTDAEFTLVELLAAIGLLSLLSVILLGSLRFGLVAWERGTAHGNRVDHIALVQNFLPCSADAHVAIGAAPVGNARRAAGRHDGALYRGREPDQPPRPVCRVHRGLACRSGHGGPLRRQGALHSTSEAQAACVVQDGVAMMPPSRRGLFVRRLAFLVGNGIVGLAVAFGCLVPLGELFADRDREVLHKRAALVRLKAVATREVRPAVGKASTEDGEFLTGKTDGAIGAELCSSIPSGDCLPRSGRGSSVFSHIESPAGRKVSDHSDGQSRVILSP